MKIQAVKLGNFKVDANKNFEYLNTNDESKVIKLAIQPFLVTTANDRVLLDVGLGFLEDGIPVILQKLNELQINPDTISKILISHLHKDHTDGLGYFNNGLFICNFPKATIYIQERAYETALQQISSSSYNHELLKALKTLSNIVWMQEDEGNLTPEIQYKVTNAHAPFHQVFWIREHNETAFYGADDLPTSGHLRKHIAFKTDFNGKKAMELRKEWEVEAVKEQWKLLFYHDMKTAVYESGAKV